MAEATCGKVIKDREDFGEFEGVTDRDYYTNSFHIPVYFPISIFDKIRIEGYFHQYCPGGHISYIELPSNTKNNVEALETIINHMAKCNMGYAGINYPIDECRNDGYSGLIEDKCPSCGSDDIRRIRRITGYLSTEDKFNDSKKAELHDRIKHTF